MLVRTFSPRLRPAPLLTAAWAQHHYCTAHAPVGGEMGHKSLLSDYGLITKIQNQFQMLNKFTACRLPLPHWYSNVHSRVTEAGGLGRWGLPVGACTPSLSTKTFIAIQ